MKIKNKHKFPKKIIVICIVAISLFACAPIYVYNFKGNLFGWKSSQDSIDNSSPIDYNPATEEQKQAGNRAKSGSNDTPLAPTIIPGSNKKGVQVTITAANQNESTLQIRSLIGAVESTGKCTLTLTSTGQSTVIKTSTTQALASTSTCQGFDVPISELSVGAWRILIEFSSDTLTGSVTKDIVIK